VRPDRKASADPPVPGETVQLDPDLRRRIGIEVFNENGPVSPPGRGGRRRRLPIHRFEGRIRESRNLRQTSKMCRGKLRALFLFPESEDEPASGHARRMKPLSKQIEQRDRDPDLLHSKPPLHVFVASVHRQPAQADDSRHPRGARLVVQKQLLRVRVHPVAQLRSGHQPMNDGEACEDQKNPAKRQPDEETLVARKRPRNPIEKPG